MGRFIQRYFGILVLTLMVTTVQAESKQELNAKVDEALSHLYQTSSAAKTLGSRAKGILVFPSVVKGGVGIGAEYGEGALLQKGEPRIYYSTASASIGVQLGVQFRSQIVMFMTNEALNKFKNSDGWEAGVDGSVAIAEFGAGKSLSTETLKAPIIGFITGNKGLMYNLTLEGSKITRLDK